METVTLKGRDFATVHNTLCELRSLQERVTGVISNELATKLHSIIQGFEQGLADAYHQDNRVFDSKMDYYSEFKSDNGLRSIWSIFELPIHGFLQDHPYRGAATVSYQGCYAAILGQTWADLYRAADSVITQSGDDHHIFIEGFLFAGDELRLTTGS
jgi:hypothetical protein